MKHGMRVSAWRWCFPGAVLTGWIGLFGGGCVHGPAALQITRVRYNDVIQQTSEEQLLLNLVRLQYRQAPSFLEIGSVSAQFTFGHSADVVGTINEGPNPVNPDRLNLQAGVAYTERPTVTFTPLQGKDFVRALLSPLPPESVALLAQSGWSIDRVLRLTVQRINGVDNASSASGPTPTRAPPYRRFARVGQLFRTLQEKGLLELGFVPQENPLIEDFPAEDLNLADVVHALSQGYRVRWNQTGQTVRIVQPARTLVWQVPSQDLPEVQEIIRLLNLVPQSPRYEIRSGWLKDLGGSADPQREIHLVMRSLLGTLFYLSQGVEVPARHRRQGLVTHTVDEQGKQFDWARVTGPLLRIHAQRRRPWHAAVAVRHRGYWFYLDDADLSSKSTFALLSQLFALQAGGVENTAPVLTLPVGG